MLECNRAVKQKITSLTRTLFILAVCVCAVILLAQAVTARNTYLINDNGRILIHSTYTTDPAKILEEVGLTLGETDTFSESRDAEGYTIMIRRSQTITVRCGGKIQQVQSCGETVQSLLSRIGVVLSDADAVSVPLNAYTRDGMEISVSRTTETERTYTQSIPYETIYCHDATLAAGETRILTAGVEGQLLCVADVRYVDGQEISTFLKSQTVVRQPVNQVVAIGTGLGSEDANLSDTPGVIRSGG